MKQGSLSKWLVLIIPVLLAVWQLYPTYIFRTMKAERDAIITEHGSDSEELARWDENNGEDFAGYKSGALKFGLDLEGGMYITMEVDLVKMIEQNAAPDAVDEVFEQVIAATKAEVEETKRDAVEVFVEKFREIAVPQQRELFDYFEFGDLDLTQESQIADKLSEASSEAIEQAIQILGQRINRYAVSETTIAQQGADRIVIEIPGVTNESEVRDLVDRPANLSFNLVRNNADVVSAFYDINQLLLKQNGADVEPESEPMADVVEPEMTDSTQVEPDSTSVENSAETVAEAQPEDSNAVQGETVEAEEAVAESEPEVEENPYEGLSDEQARAQYSKDFPFTSLFTTYFIAPGSGQYQPVGFSTRQFPQGEYYFQIPGDSLARFRELMDRDDIRALIPPEYDVLLSANPDQRILRQENEEVYEIWSVKGDPELKGDVVVDAQQDWDPLTNQPEVAMSMDAEGAERWAKITQANVGKRVAIVLDSAVYSAPNVNEPIFGGRSSISGSADRAEAKILAIILKAGALKAPIEIVQERVVGPSLGEDSISAGVNASLAALVLVLIFMVLYYAMAGAVADIAVFFNLLLILTLLAGFGGTLTLPGIAGLILTIGMAVDANVLIFERIREELAAGRALRSAVDVGYSKSYSAILDSNITTFITGVILFYMGSGPIQGFAVTLMIGIGMTLFTAIFVTRAIIELSLLRGANSFNFGQPKIAAS